MGALDFNVIERSIGYLFREGMTFTLTLTGLSALGLTLPQTYRYVLLPMAYRIILPPLTSETMNLIKNTSVALTIGLVELTAAARSVQEFTFQVFEAFTAATVIYIIVNLIVVNLMRWLERSVAVPGFIGPQVAEGAH